MFGITTIDITPEILGLIAELEDFKGAWRASNQLVPERLSSLRRVATVESVGSSTRIEGSQLSDREVETLLSTLEIVSLDTRDFQEVAGYAETMDLIFYAWEEMALTENHIRQLHRDLLLHSEKDAYHRGSYKTHANSVAAFSESGQEVGIIFHTASPFETPRLMTEVVTWAREQLETKQLHSLLVIAIFILVFLEIHPFEDGNGRLSRILTTLLLLRAGYGYVPYSSLESVVEQNKEGYYLALRQTQGTVRSESPDWQPWLLFFLRSMHQQMQRLAKKIERERLVLGVLPRLSAAIVEQAREHGRVTIGEMVKLTGASRNTLKEHFRRLIEKRQLVLHGSGRGAWYALA